MGYGEVSGNQSVHWKICHDKGSKKVKVNHNNDSRPIGDDEVNIDKDLHGRDPKQVDHFQVRLRFNSPEEATQAVQAGTAKISSEGGSYYVTLSVPAYKRAHPDDPPPADVRIDW